MFCTSHVLYKLIDKYIKSNSLNSWILIEKVVKQNQCHACIVNYELTCHSESITVLIIKGMCRWHVVITNSAQNQKSKLKEKCNSGAEQTWTPKKLEVGLGAVEEKIPFYIV